MASLPSVYIFSEARAKRLEVKLLAWWQVNARTFDWRQTSDKYELLIAELLLRRTNAKAVQKIYGAFFKEYPSIEHFSKADPETIRSIVRSLGLRWRADNLLELAKFLDKNTVAIPDNVEDFMTWPGVGPYVSRCVLVNSIGLRQIPVDGNIVRVVCRLQGLVPNDSFRRNAKFQEAANSLLNESSTRALNYALLDFSAAVCKARSPDCTTCPLRADCASSKKFIEEGFASQKHPNKKGKD